MTIMVTGKAHLIEHASRRSFLIDANDVHVFQEPAGGLPDALKGVAISSLKAVTIHEDLGPLVWRIEIDGWSVVTQLYSTQELLISGDLEFSQQSDTFSATFAPPLSQPPSRPIQNNKSLVFPTAVKVQPSNTEQLLNQVKNLEALLKAYPNAGIGHNNPPGQGWKLKLPQRCQGLSITLPGNWTLALPNSTKSFRFFWCGGRWHGCCRQLLVCQSITCHYCRAYPAFSSRFMDWFTAAV